MATHGEIWLQRALARVEGYCKTRGYRLRGAWRTQRHRFEQWVVEVEDSHFQRTELAVNLYDNGFAALDDAGREVAPLTASLFDELTAGLAPRAKPSKRQLAFAI